MKDFISLDDLREMMVKHPDFSRCNEWGNEDSVTVMIERKGHRPKTVTIYKAYAEERSELHDPAYKVWEAYPRTMMRRTAWREAIELVFPEFKK